MKKYLLIIILCILFIPGVVNAEEYTFNVCKTCEWNESNIDDLASVISNLDIAHSDSIKVNIADGNYSFANEFYIENDNVRNLEIIFGNGNYNFGNGFNVGWNYEYTPIIRFGVGTYIFDELSFGDNQRVYGAGIDKTIIKGNNQGWEESYESTFHDLTIDMNDSIGFWMMNLDLSNSYNIEPKLDLKNVKFITNTESSFNNPSLEIYGESNILIDNVNVNGKYVFIENTKDFSIINSDFSKSFISIEADAFDGSNLTEVIAKNTKFNKVFVSGGMKLIADCDCNFVNGIKRYNYYSYENIYEEDEATIFEQYDPEQPDEIDGYVINSLCKDKTIKITNSINLNKIKEEYGYEIDDSWNINPLGIVEIKDSKIVPIKVGKTNISKEINGEIQTLRVEVTPDQITDNTIVNPNTSSTLLFVLIISLSLLISFIVIKNRKKSIIS